MQIKKYILWCLFIVLLAGCSKCTSNKKKIAKWATSIDGSVIPAGTTLTAHLKYLDEEVAIDSLVIGFNGVRINSYASLTQEIQIPTAGLKMGGYTLMAIVYRDSHKEEYNASVTIVSDIVPQENAIKTGAVYPHSNQNFTEGLFFNNGMVYESTGMNGTSFICRYKLGSAPEKLTTMPTAYFGEGSILYDNKLIQLTWKNGKGIVYDATTYKQTGEFLIGGEGWGLTYDGTNLIMSDGSHRLFYLDKQTYANTKILEVYDNKGPVMNLNELEFVDGVIYANAWMTDKIAKIDASTGKVISYLNCEGLLTEEEIEMNKCDVLNGIAYDAKTKKLYITGKNWPKIFEVKL